MADPKVCAVCGARSVKKDLCRIHYDRQWRNGTFESLRPKDWGQRSKHPLWERWKGLQKRVIARDPAWDDFWRFVQDVGAAPNGRAALVACRDDEPIGPSNWAWRENASIHLDKTTREGRNAYMREWNARNPGKSRQNHLRRYGITLAEYDVMAEEQNYLCKICQKPEQRKMRLNVDHCHGTGKVRGLLCNFCNTAIGLLKDDPELIERVAAYIRANKPAVAA